ncbi:Aste57867_9381 [Aphanomyces stellatus]|uniref:Aste57867_9381 protein n=1 Tax=Aphanomyces stellatus TaxID=120398 RepID=A0A485KMX0_9STRA|nr:hypothetical protein As57867_009345 [Aphanomyces stellatus]VFT86262.1 Aste57867_9381 [Aphanomyces stellatus]
MQAPSKCFFNGCNADALPGLMKCLRHKRKGICTVDQCRNQVNKRGLCVGHGARDLCVVPGCASLGRSAGLCARHAKGCTSMTSCAVGSCRRRVLEGKLCAYHAAKQAYDSQAVAAGDVDDPFLASFVDADSVTAWMGELHDVLDESTAVPSLYWSLVCDLSEHDPTITSLPTLVFDDDEPVSTTCSTSTFAPLFCAVDCCLRKVTTGSEWCATHVNNNGLLDATNDVLMSPDEVNDDMVFLHHDDALSPPQEETSSTSWLEWCTKTSSPPTVLLKDICTFVGVAELPPVSVWGADAESSNLVSCEFEFVPVDDDLIHGA